jgi:hypothetical protein
MELDSWNPHLRLGRSHEDSNEMNGKATVTHRSAFACRTVNASSICCMVKTLPYIVFLGLITLGSVCIIVASENDCLSFEIDAINSFNEDVLSMEMS